MRKIMVPSLVLIAAFVTAAATSALAAPTAIAQSSDRRIVAVGDVHGAYDVLVDVLRAAALVDDKQAWTGGDAVLVQTGDLLDGGADIRSVLDLMMRLQQEARAAGGDVIVLLGDHEVLNLLGELRDASPAAIASFAGDDQTKTLRDAFKEYATVYFAQDAAWRRATRPKRDDIRDEWIQDQTPGRVEYLRAMGPDSPYGAWLRTLPVTVVLDGVLFMHAGITPQLAAWSLDDINERLAAEIAALDAYRSYLRREKKATSFADLAETIRGIRLDAGGVDWFQAPREQLNKPPALPATELRHMEPQQRAEPLLRINGWFALAGRGPIWFKGLSESPEGALEAQLPGLLEATGARAIVAGHTQTPDGNVQVRAGGRVFLIDTGMLQSVEGAKGSALIIDGDRFEAVYADGSRQSLPTPPAS